MLPHDRFDILFDLCEILGIRESVIDGTHRPPVYGYYFRWQQRQERKKEPRMTPHGWKWRQSSNDGKKKKERNSEEVGKDGLTSKYFYYEQGGAASAIPVAERDASSGKHRIVNPLASHVTRNMY